MKAEATLEAKLRKYALSRDCLVYKFVSPGTVGVPDRIIVSPTGCVGFLEIKAPGQHPKPIQYLRIKEIRDRLGLADWVATFEHGKAFIDSLCL